MSRAALRPAGSGGAGPSAASPLLDDVPASPASRLLASGPATLGTRPTAFFSNLLAREPGREPPWEPDREPARQRRSPRELGGHRTVGGLQGFRIRELLLERLAQRGREAAAQQRDAPWRAALERPVRAQGGRGVLELLGVGFAVPIGDPGEQPPAGPLVDGKPVAAPAGGGGVGLALIVERLIEQDPDALLAHLAHGGTPPAGESGVEVGPDDDDRVVALAEPFLGVQDLLGRARRVGAEGVVEQLLAAVLAHAHAEGEALGVGEQQ